MLSEDDKQFKLDVEDIIEEQMQQCVQFFNRDCHED